MTCVRDIYFARDILYDFPTKGNRRMTDIVEWAIVVAWLVIGLGLSAVTRAKANNKAAAAAK